MNASYVNEILARDRNAALQHEAEHEALARIARSGRTARARGTSLRPHLPDARALGRVMASIRGQAAI